MTSFTILNNNHDDQKMKPVMLVGTTPGQSEAAFTHTLSFSHFGLVILFAVVREDGGM